MSESSSTPEFMPVTPALGLFAAYGDRWSIVRADLVVFVAVRKTGTSSRILAGSADERAARIAAVEAEKT